MIICRCVMSRFCHCRWCCCCCYFCFCVKSLDCFCVFVFFLTCCLFFSCQGGKLHTYEFNRVRADKARKEFEGHGLGHLVEVYNRDVCGKTAMAAPNGASEVAASSDGTTADACEVDDGRGGFQLGPAAAHAIFLDLPEPWLAVPHAAHTIKPNGRLCSYSPVSTTGVKFNILIQNIINLEYVHACSHGRELSAWNRLSGRWQPSAHTDFKECGRWRRG